MKTKETMDQEKWRIRTEEAMASMERMRQHPVSYEELVLNQYRNDKQAGRKNDFLLKSKKAREILAQWIDGNDNVSHEGRTLPGDAATEELQQTMAWKALVLAFRI